MSLGYTVRRGAAVVSVHVCSACLDPARRDCCCVFDALASMKRQPHGAVTVERGGVVLASRRSAYVPDAAAHPGRA